MLMGNRDLGPHDESKDFTDKLGPLRRWLASQVGRNWDWVYSEIKDGLSERQQAEPSSARNSSAT
jgi:hypothetical protein